jgi:23S rRNA-/tRNA-specific pseudouridylate synthase
MKRHFLHASQLSFDHPESDERMSFESPLPKNLQNIQKKLKL